MSQFSLNMNSRYQRPVVELKSWYNFEALLDTGAYIPIWTVDEELLKDIGGKCIQVGMPFGGFGGETKGNLYVLPSLSVGDLIFPNLYIVACSDLKNTPFQLILSATMFQNLIYEIEDKNHRLNIIIPDDESRIRNLKVIDKNGKIHIST